MQFADVDRRYAELNQQFQSGALSAEQFDEALKSMMVQDDQGRWWAKAREGGDWNYYDNASGTWVHANPPVSGPPPGLPPGPQAAPPAAAQPSPQPTPQPAQFTGQAPAPGPVSQPFSSAAGVPPQYSSAGSSGGELSSGLKVVFYILSFFVPIVGVVLFFVYRTKPAQADRSAANLFLILGLVSFGLSCFCWFMMALMSSGSGY